MSIKKLFKIENAGHFSSINRRLNNLPRPLYQYLIGVNFGVFIMWHLPVFNKKFMREHFTLSKYNIYYNKYYHTMITSGFSHNGLIHLGFNMVTFYFFGKVIEQTFGRLTLFQLYLVGSFFCSVFSLNHANKFYGDSNFFGASGSIASILTFFILNFPNEIIYVYFIPVPAWALGMFIFGYSIMNIDSQSQVSHAGHFGGMLGGALYYILKKRM